MGCVRIRLNFFSMVEEYCEESFPLEDNDGNNEEIDKYFKASHYLSESFQHNYQYLSFGRLNKVPIP